MQIAPKSQWRYVGPGEGKQLIHVVLISEPHEIVTWCDDTAGAAGGWSWLGDSDEFLKQFKPL
jgi:hypothetical protein